MTRCGLWHMTIIGFQLKGADTCSLNPESVCDPRLENIVVGVHPAAEELCTAPARGVVSVLGRRVPVRAGKAPMSRSQAIHVANRRLQVAAAAHTSVTSEGRAESKN
mmetsp:Transcript_38917/g.91841  ORF Transcript_38917/g.91841 Transcript_38917/m.91841 type:complete len:107 (+) Transcript_38917:641-961(+)